MSSIAEESLSVESGQFGEYDTRKLEDRHECAVGKITKITTLQYYEIISLSHQGETMRSERAAKFKKKYLVNPLFK